MSLIPISTIAQPNIWQRKDSTIFTIGLMIEHGIHWVVLLVAQFTQD